MADSKEALNPSEDIKLDEDEMVIGLSVPLEEPAEAQAYPPIHKHEANAKHDSDSDKNLPGTNNPTKEKVNFADTEKPTVIPDLIDQDKPKTLPEDDEPTVLHLDDPEDEDVTYFKIDTEEETIKRPLDEEVKAYSHDHKENELITGNFEVPNTENPLDNPNHLPTSKEVDYSYQDPHMRFHAIEPDTGIHGVKMANGHIHLNNTTYDYFDPSQPHTEDVHNFRNSKMNDYLVYALFFAAFLLFLYAAYRLYRWMFDVNPYSRFNNERSDSQTSYNSYNEQEKIQEFKRKEMKAMDDELKGELDPVTFYKNQQQSTKPENSKRNVKKIDLEFNSQSHEEDSNYL